MRTGMLRTDYSHQFVQCSKPSFYDLPTESPPCESFLCADSFCSHVVERHVGIPACHTLSHSHLTVRESLNSLREPFISCNKLGQVLPLCNADREADLEEAYKNVPVPSLVEWTRCARQPWAKRLARRSHADHSQTKWRGQSGTSTERAHTRYHEGIPHLLEPCEKTRPQATMRLPQTTSPTEQNERKGGVLPCRALHHVNLLP